MEKYFLQVRKKSYGNRLFEFHQRYIDYLGDPDRVAAQSPREFFYDMIERNNLSSVLDYDISCPLWPNYIRATIGRLLFDLIIKDVKVDENFESNEETHMVPGFTKLFDAIDVTTNRTRVELDIHTMLSTLAKYASKGQIKVGEFS